MADAAADEPQEDNGILGGGIHRMIMIFIATQCISNLFGPPKTPPGVPTEERELTKMEKWAKARLPEQPAPAPRFSSHDAHGNRLAPHMRRWEDDHAFHLHAFYGCSNETSDLTPLWAEGNLTYSFDAANIRTQTFQLFRENATACLQRAWTNQTVFLHLFATANETFDLDHIEMRTVAELTMHRPLPQGKKGRSLLDDAVEEEEVVYDDRPVLHWKPTLDVRMAMLPPVFERGAIPDPVSRLLTFDEAGDYLPPLHKDEFWLLGKSLQPMNASVKALNLTVSFDIDGTVKWQLKSSMEQSWRQQAKLGMGSVNENDMLREMLLETKPWVLALTFIVSILHTLFEFLAFRNNVKFWRNKKTLVGLSARTIAWNAVCQLIVMLYLLDNDTSWMVLFSSGMALLTEAWKLTKAVTFEDGKLRLEESYAESPTKAYDDVATSHLMYLLAPLLVGFSTYSLVTDLHKGWYSWLVSSAVGFIYAFGFVMMTPQLYINYRLRSVAHLPWRAMVYKSLNTFIDDIFAFIIKQPTLRRLACLRDDVIFLATLYQRYLYPVDKTRVNEFGQGGADDADDADAVDALKLAAASAPAAPAALDLAELAAGPSS